ncbi:hypothetical protein CAEBREN_00701 [Caenorhabditis brenneri]|uniref:Uncharacterized protein n=1 Tax=Caenorhabditis brenneri TaxID=135651 RepID=G0NHB1_CAEBE|nr:hypothetical protein CAEBREN_00701 [Caenorhabditis brenneri]
MNEKDLEIMRWYNRYLDVKTQLEYDNKRHRETKEFEELERSLEKKKMENLLLEKANEIKMLVAKVDALQLELDGLKAKAEKSKE